MREIKISFFFLMMLVLCNCNNQKNNSENSVEIISTELLKAAGTNIQLIDVRTPEEYSTGYILEAQNINFFDEDFLVQLKGLQKDKPVYVYCKKGKRASKASLKMEEAGFSKVYNLEGGITNWIEKGNKLSSYE